jgi:hypothetical protein
VISLITLSILASVLSRPRNGTSGKDSGS